MKLFKLLCVCLCVMFLGGCADSANRSKALGIKEYINIQNASELGLDGLEKTVEKINVLVAKKASPEEIKKALGEKNLGYWDQVDIMNLYFPHPGITMQLVPKGIVECINNGLSYYGLRFNLIAWNQYYTSNTVLHLLNFKRIRIKTGYQYLVIFTFNEKNEMIDVKITQGPIYEKDKENNPLGPLNGHGVDDFVNVPKVGF